MSKWAMSARAMEHLDNLSAVIIVSERGEKFARRPISEQEYYLEKIGIVDQFPVYDYPESGCGYVPEIKQGDYIRIIPISCSSI